jgi:putative endonuclease
MVLCADGTLYTGWTYDLAARVEAHNLGRGARYTAGRRPVRLVFSEPLPSKGEALRRAIKRLPRQEKEKLAAERIGVPLVSPGEGGL